MGARTGDVGRQGGCSYYWAQCQPHGTVMGDHAQRGLRLMGVGLAAVRLTCEGTANDVSSERGVDPALLVSCGLPAFRDCIRHIPRQSGSSAELGNRQTGFLDALSQGRRASLMLLIQKLDPILHRNGSTSCTRSIPARRVLVIQERLSYTPL